MKRLKLHLTLNTRDLGGYETKDGEIISPNKIIRSDALRYITEEDKLFLLNNKIINQIDLRTEEISKKYPSLLEDDERFFYHLVPIKEGSLRSFETNPDIPLLYMKMVSNKEAFNKIFTLLDEMEGGVIINCTAGKDRTGIVIYLLLSILGVDVKDIKKDYLYSQECIDKMIKEVRKEKEDFPTFLGYAKEEYFDSFNKMFIKKYGSAKEYLISIGIKLEQIENIKKKFLMR